MKPVNTRYSDVTQMDNGARIFWSIFKKVINTENKETMEACKENLTVYETAISSLVYLIVNEKILLKTQ